MDTKNKKLTIFFELIIVVFSSVISALGLHVFVYPANFAPSGFDGISAMLQKLTGLNAGIYLAIFNIPLLIWAYFKLNRKYVIYTIIFTIISSALLYIFELVNLYQYVSTTDRILPAIFAGIILGIRTGLMIKIGSSTGGIDIIACMIQSKKPHLDLEKSISVMCYVIILISVFVYDNDITCILLSIVQIFTMEKAMGFILKDNRNAVEVKIITKDPELLKEKILFKLKHGATVINCTGMYTGEPRYMVITIINIRQIGELTGIIRELPDTFIYHSDVTGVRGNFRWKKTDEPH